MTRCMENIRNRRQRTYRVSLLLLLLVVSAPSRANAQETVPPHASGWMLGAALGVPGTGRDAAQELLIVGVHATDVRPGRFGADLALGTIPRVLAEGIVGLGVRAGVTVPLALTPRVLLLPAVGWSAVGAVAVGGASGVVGGYAGASTLLLGTDRTGVRVGTTWHRFMLTPEDSGDNKTLWLFEVAIVWRPGDRSVRAR